MTEIINEIKEHVADRLNSFTINVPRDKWKEIQEYLSKNKQDYLGYDVTDQSMWFKKHENNDNVSLSFHYNGDPLSEPYYSVWK